MYFDDPYFGSSLASSPAGHVSWQGTTVNPGDVLLTQPSCEPTQSDGIPHNVVAGHGFVGYPAVNDTPQETLQCHPPIWPSQSMSHPLGLSFDINDDFTRQFTGAMRPVRRMFRGVRVGDTVSMTCLWQSQGSSICGQEITGETVSEHLAGHGIRNMRRDHITQCCWRECGTLMKRQSITRHFREVHLGLKRKSCARASSTTLVADALWAF